MTLTFVGRYKGSISVSLAVVDAVEAPFALPPNPFAPMGESISIGVDAMVAESLFRDFERLGGSSDTLDQKRYNHLDNGNSTRLGLATSMKG